VRRRTIHFVFGAATIGFGAIATYHVVRLHQANQINEAIASASVSSADSGLPEAQFARALALSESGDTSAAVQIYKALIQGDRADLQRAALYNLGNLHLREALKSGPDEAARSLPLIELAKQSYRDLLRVDPTDWDARYNLERALWLAPEVEQADAPEPPEPPERATSTAPGRTELP
jgi:mxaK protein